MQPDLPRPRGGDTSGAIELCIKEREVFESGLSGCDKFASSARAELVAIREENARLREAKVTLDTWGLALVEKLGAFVRQTASNGPLTTCIECRVGEEGEGVPLVWLWATTSQQSPEARIAEVVADRDRLKTILGERLGTAPSTHRLVPLERLREIEFIAMWNERAEWKECPACRMGSDVGHATGCWIGEETREVHAPSDR
jgi:hypothetical protein